MRAITEYPEGFEYFEDFLSAEEEKAVLEYASRVEYEPFIMRGQPSKRGIKRYGYDYGSAGGSIKEPPPIPDELIALRDLAAKRAGLPPEIFISVLLTRYTPGAAIGWHKDFPMFGPQVLGISLGSSCTFKLRNPQNTSRVFSIELQPRSMYVLGGAARNEWEHSIPPAKTLRYSVTFRSRKSKA